jgi:hypothetical protein
MNRARCSFTRFVTVLFLALALCACGGSPWRFTPGAAQKPAGLVATAGDSRVSLSWSPADGAASYAVYYSASPGVVAASATKIPGITGTSALVPGLLNGIRYYFAVSAVNATGESPLSDQATGIPWVSGTFLQSDLQGTWRFNALVSGPGAKWMRGTLAIDASGAVSVGSFLDSSGIGAAPAGLFGTMSILPDGSVFQDGAADFHGVLSANLHKDLLVATASAGGNSPLMLILQKSVPGISFSAADIKGTGRLVAGPLSLVYHQLSSGAVSEWESAGCQVGQDQGLTYTSLNAASFHPLPGAGAKVVALSITADGTVSETPNAAVAPQPAALITQGVMSADKMTIVGTATDLHGAFILRVIQLIHPPATLLTSSSYALAGLAGSYGYHALIGGASPRWSYGTQSIAASGALAFSAYLDSSGSLAAPVSALLAMDQQGMLTDSADLSYNGQFSYFKDMMVATSTDSAGISRMSIALRSSN